MKRYTAWICSLTLMAFAGATIAADNGTEFGIDDDLIILGAEGTAPDPDLEVKGFSVFGSTQAAYYILPAAGSAVVNGELQVSSGIYSAGSSTFTQRVEIQGFALLASTVALANNVGNAVNLYLDNAAVNSGKVLKATANGFLSWEADNNTVMTFQTPYRIQMVNGTDDDLADSLLAQNTGSTNITLISGSSFTVTGALETVGTAKFNGDVYLGDAAGDAVTAAGAVTAQSGVSVTGGTLAAANTLTVDGSATLGNAISDTHGVNIAPEAGTALKVAGDGAGGSYAAKFYLGGSMAAWIRKK